jgi:hypothetical protein
MRRTTAAPLNPWVLYGGALGFCGAYVLARFLLKFPDLATALKVGIALLPVPFFIWLLWAMMRYVGTLDELEQRIQLEALAIAFTSAMLLLMTLGLMQLAVKLSEHDWSYRHVWAYLPLAYYIGLMIARKRYQ